MDTKKTYEGMFLLDAGNPDFNTASAVKLITESSGAIKSIVEKGSSKSRTAWWEIRQ